MQAKDIPEIPVLRFLRALNWTWGNWYKITFGDGTENPTSVLRAMPAGTPSKVALAKMRALIKRGLVEGCPCGCRGDFVLSSEGKKVLEEAEKNAQA